jgi:hypothetical protein
MGVMRIEHPATVRNIDATTPAYHRVYNEEIKSLFDLEWPHL